MVPNGQNFLSGCFVRPLWVLCAATTILLSIHGLPTIQQEPEYSLPHPRASKQQDEPFTKEHAIKLKPEELSLMQAKERNASTEEPLVEHPRSSAPLAPASPSKTGADLLRSLVPLPELSDETEAGFDKTSSHISREQQHETSTQSTSMAALIASCKPGQCFCTSAGGDTCDGAPCVADQCTDWSMCDDGGYWCVAGSKVASITAVHDPIEFPRDKIDTQQKVAHESLLEMSLSDAVKTGAGSGSTPIAAVAVIVALIALAAVAAALFVRNRNTNGADKEKAASLLENADDTKDAHVSERPAPEAKVSARTGRPLISPKRGQTVDPAQAKLAHTALQGHTALAKDDVDKIRAIMVAEVEAAKKGDNVDVSLSKLDDPVRVTPTLVVKIVEARNIMAKDDCGTSDPFITLVVGGEKRKSKVVFKNLNPKWDQTFRFDWPAKPHDIAIVMWDDDSNEADANKAHALAPQPGDTANADFLGKVDIKAKQLQQIHKEGRDKMSQFKISDWPVSDTWYKLCKRSIRSHVKGDLRIQLSWENAP